MTRLKSTMLVLLGASKVPMTDAEAAEMRRARREAERPERIIVVPNPPPTSTETSITSPETQAETPDATR